MQSGRVDPPSIPPMTTHGSAAEAYRSLETINNLAMSVESKWNLLLSRLQRIRHRSPAYAFTIFLSFCHDLGISFCLIASSSCQLHSLFQLFLVAAISIERFAAARMSRSNRRSAGCACCIPLPRSLHPPRGYISLSRPPDTFLLRHPQQASWVPTRLRRGGVDARDAPI